MHAASAQKAHSFPLSRRMCFEETGEGTERPAKTLGCCHRTCAECWREWSAAHPAPFCPLCLHVEFLEVLRRTVAATPPVRA